MKLNRLPLLFLFASVPILLHADPTSHFKACYEKQAEGLGEKLFSFSYKETARNYYHSMHIWDEDTSESFGAVSAGRDFFLQRDTTMYGDRPYVTKLQSTAQDINNFTPHDSLHAVRETDDFDRVFESARYCPVFLLQYARKHIISIEKESDSEFSVVSLWVRNTRVTLFIRNSDDLLEKVTLFDNKEGRGLYGDVTTVYNYSEYESSGGFWFPRTIIIDKINGKLQDTVRISPIRIDDKPLFEIDNELAWEETQEKGPDVSVEKFSKNIYLVQLKHDDFQSLIIEFEDFLVVTEAPLNSANGELVIAEAQRIAPGKPIRYFLFNHFHNWYSGGFRPFVQRGVTILSKGGNKPYLDYLASAPHTIDNDRLQQDPKAVKFEELKDSATISDGKYVMKVYHIGEKSAHTYDYLVYYFPAEKMLFEGDLVFVKAEGVAEKASKPERGLYNAIKELRLDVKTIVQAWPMGGSYGVKSVIPFRDLEASANMK